MADICRKRNALDGLIALYGFQNLYSHLVVQLVEANIVLDHQFIFADHVQQLMGEQLCYCLTLRLII